MHRTVSSLIIALTTAVGSVGSSPAFANAESAVVVDTPTATLTLKDGRTITGAIAREAGEYIWIDLGLGNAVMYGPDDYVKIERSGGAASSAPVELNTTTSYRDEPIEKKPGVFRAAVLSLEGTVGTHMAAPPLKEAIEELEEDQIDLLVLKVNSGGGMLIEIEKMSNIIENEFKPRFKTVAWIESAISAAAMTSYTCEDIYFMTRGNFGSATGWFQSGSGIGLVEGRDLEEALYLMERIAERGEHSPELFRSMQILEPLSAVLDSDGNPIEFRNDLTGDVIINEADDIISFNSQEAVRWNLSRGVADSISELGAMIIEQNPDLGIQDIVWVGERLEDEPYPITEAEKLQRTWREEADFIDNRLGELFTKYQMSLQNAQARRSFTAQAERYLAQLERLARKHTNLAFTRNLSEEWFRQQREFIADLRRR